MFTFFASFDDLGLISSMFYEQLLRTKILKAQNKDNQVVSIFGAFGICMKKSCSYDVDEIDP
jgi:hypothetical protein